ncbi:Reverse transcriptase domain, partial [Cinara cedri]
MELSKEARCGDLEDKPNRQKQKTDIKKRLRSKKKEMVTSAIYSSEFSTDEIRMVLKEIKLNKAAGFDGIYSEFFKHSGHKTQAWLAAFCSDILDTATLPKLFKKTKIIAILKPGKPATDPTHYRPISLLSTTYKILERLILNRIRPEIVKILPVEQAGFRTNRSCAKQVLALTTLNEKGFQNNLKTNVAFIDFTVAYDTVWRHGLLYKLANVIPCKNILTFVENMLTNRRFQVFMRDKKSRWRISNPIRTPNTPNTPTLFNLYIHDLPITPSFKFQYEDDIALAYQCKDMGAGNEMLTKDLKIMSDYFYKWRLNPNPSKTEICAFHLYNRQADREFQ